MRNENALQKPELPPPVNPHKKKKIPLLKALKLIPADFYKLPTSGGGNSVLRSLRWRVGSTYRKLFAIVWFSNMIALAIYCYHHFRNGMSVKDQNAQIMV